MDKLLHNKKALYIVVAVLVLAGLVYLFTRPRTTGVAPTLDSVYPSTVAQNAEDTQLSLNGSNFSRESVAVLNGSQYLQTSFFSDKQLNATIPSLSLGSAGTLQVKIVNTVSNQSSGSLTITVSGTAVPPMLSSISPTSGSVTDASLTITATGTGFDSGSVIKWDTTALTTSCPSDTNCSASVPANLYAAAGTYPIVVANGSLASSAIQFTVSDPNHSIIVVPNNGSTPISVQVGTPLSLKAIGNVAGNSYSVNWGLSPTSGASISPATGATTVFSCSAAGGPFTVTATATGLTAGTGVYQCASSGGGGGVGSSINLPDCSQTSFSNAWGQMSSGAYTLNFPNCSATWTSSVSKTIPSSVTGVTLHGNTTVSCTGTHGTATYACPAVDKTVIIDASTASYSPIMIINTGSSFFRVTGMTFQGGNTGTVHRPDGFFQLSGASKAALRFDHNHFNTCSYSGGCWGGGMTLHSQFNGVFDHNLFSMGAQNNGVRIYPESTGDAAWSQPTDLGSSNFVFVEDNVFVGGFANDCHYGGREVVRYNSLSADPNDYTADSGVIQTHATSQGVPRARGCRAMERYYNYFMNPTPVTPQFSAMDGNVGGGVVYGNTVNTGYNNDVVLQACCRVLGGNNCGAGYNNAGGCKAPPNGFGYCGTGSSGVSSPWDANSNSQGYPCLDQPGRGQSDLLNGANFPSTLNTVTNSASWPRNKREPYYIWNESVPTGKYVCNTQTFNGVPTVANRDYYCQVSSSPNTSLGSPFNGTSGTGWGTLANRPTTCTAGPGGAYETSPTGSYGVGYFATDQNILYVCTATNVWTNVYKPYTYPHPLTAAP